MDIDTQQDDSENSLRWQALEYEDRKRDPDWFWALGIIVVTSTLAALIFGNYFFGGLLLLGGALIAFFAVKPPDLVFFELNKDGLKVRSRLYPYENIVSFFVQHTDRARDLPPKLFIKSQRVFMPIIVVPIADEDSGLIQEIFANQNIPEEEMREHLAEKVMEYFGF